MVRRRPAPVQTVCFFAFALLALPAIGLAQVTTIKAITVTVGSNTGSITYCDTTQSCGGNEIWNLSGGVALGASQTLILTQTGTSPEGGGNFDTSDRFPLDIACSQTDKCTVTIAIDTGKGLKTVYKSSSGNPLNAYNQEPAVDPPSPVFNEAADWVTVYTGKDFSLALGYADNEHQDPCGANPHDADHDCLPQPNFGPGGATVFLGLGLSGLGACSSDCYDAGAVMITSLAPPPPAAHGCTPGFWKTHDSNPPWGSYLPTQTVGSVFTIPFGVSASFTNEKLVDALQGGGGKGLDGQVAILLRAAVAALLNADIGNPPYPSPYQTPSLVISATNSALASLNTNTINMLAMTLDTLNNNCDQGGN